MQIYEGFFITPDVFSGSSNVLVVATKEFIEDMHVSNYTRNTDRYMWVNSSVCE
jgi:hypothetical protein